MRHAIALLLVLALAACASGPRQSRIPEKVINRALQGAPGEAQPSRIVAAELAFARAAREQGQWTAFNEFAAEGAVLHGRSGPIEAKPWLAQQANPETAVQWTPLAVWMSCNGRTAVSQGKAAQPGGIWGYYVTVWEQQADRSYRYVYDVGGDDPALTERENRGRDPLEADSLITVEAIPLIRGEVADCPARGEQPDAGGIAVDALAETKAYTSADGTLQWAWVQHDDGRRQLLAQLWQGGEWREALQFEIAPDGTVAR